jgi:ferredoxin
MQPRLTALYDFLRAHALPFQKTAYATFGLTLGLFAAIFALELVARRFWCRYLCPLGALLGLAGRWALLRRLPVKDCGKCKAASNCGTRCRMGAFDGSGKLVGESCNLCMDCVADCPSTVARFKFKKPVGAVARAPVGLSRRGFLTASALGVALPVVAKSAGAASPKPEHLPPHLIRPPGVADARTEEDFLNLCIRCGECLKVCTTNGLQPAALEAGWAGIFSPVLTPRTGYCLVSCTLCSQVCPTGAIPRLAPETKAQAVMGKAAFDRDRCLPWAKNEECICCEEHCPVPEKAIQFHVVKVTFDGTEKELQRPYVLHERCIGCGICENKCPLDGPAAIHVYRKDAVPPEGPNAGLIPATAPATRPSP